ncbi:hypothetical protein OGAPHI_000445 [Ogataea philodendri]|uniref:Uncharacterized protein n=1 Tax=Ogataea philodendri TaxID=1378263 RepID=A0A9P8PHR2_9ASCO|nr:uncharacterized protein OGAPHI_000445 [Ogataea philodendri]KAH3671740.1 hypothetical protein OGAPHI_000445 [Ogataea philodendri]
MFGNVGFIVQKPDRIGWWNKNLLFGTGICAHGDKSIAIGDGLQSVELVILQRCDVDNSNQFVVNVVALMNRSFNWKSSDGGQLLGSPSVETFPIRFRSQFAIFHGERRLA